MKRIIIVLAVLAMTGSAFAQVDPQRPMVTGRGNVEARPEKVIVTNQTATEADADTIVLERYVVTGSLLPKAPVRAKATTRVHLKR